MTCEKNTVTRTNFASRLLNKAMSERKTGEFKKPEITVTTVTATESFAPAAGSAPAAPEAVATK
jgi:hypothetical protein